MKTIFKTAEWISIYSVIVPSVLSLIYFKKHCLTDRLIFLMLLIACIPQLASAIVVKNNLPVFYNLYTIADVTIWSFIFFINTNKKNSYWILAISGVIIFSFIIFLLLEGVNKKFYSEMVCVDSFMQIIFVQVFFYEEYKKDKLFEIGLNPFFWYCLSITIYAPSTYFLFAFRDIINNSKNGNFEYLWHIHDFFNVVFYFLIAFGILKAFKKSSLFGN